MQLGNSAMHTSIKNHMDIYHLVPKSKRGLEFAFVSLSVKLAPNGVKNIWEGYEK